jgi:hypothetical protein
MGKTSLLKKLASDYAGMFDGAIEYFGGNSRERRNAGDVIHRHSRSATERSNVDDVVGENHERLNLGSKSMTIGGECIRRGGGGQG